MGKKKIFSLGSEDEEQLKAKRATQLEQKKLRLGKKTESTPEAIIEPEISNPEPEVKKTKKQVKIRSKAYQSAKTKIDAFKSYDLKDALKLLREVSLSKFDGTVELHLTTKEIGTNYTIDLPHSTGKNKVIAIATDEVVSEIEKGSINFTVLLATPAQMPKLVKLAKVLGPKGLMPNPKTGTVVPDPEATKKKLEASSTVTLKTEKSAPVIHTIVGKLSHPDKNLSANIVAIFASVKPLKAVLKSTISPAIKIIT